MSIVSLPPSVKDTFQAFNDQDLDKLIADFADDATFYDPARPEGISPAEYRTYCAELFEAFPDGHWEVERFVEGDGEPVAVEWIYRGTFKGEIEGIPPTGESFALPGTSIIHIEEGQIVYWRDYWDQRQFFAQVGLTFPTIVRHGPRLVARKVRGLL